MQLVVVARPVPPQSDATARSLAATVFLVLVVVDLKYVLSFVPAAAEVAAALASL